MAVDVQVSVECDRCGREFEGELFLTEIVTYLLGWDVRGVIEDVEDGGWAMENSGFAVCSECVRVSQEAEEAPE